MTWWSEYSAVPRFVLASSAIRCRFVDRFAGCSVPSVFQANGSLLVTPPSPPPGPAEHGSPPSQVVLRRYDFPPAHPVPLFLFGRRSHALLHAFVLAEALPGTRGGRSQAWNMFIGRRSYSPASAPMDASGISQVPWRSVPCLCPAPRPRPSRRGLAHGGLPDAAPGFPTPKASAITKISRLTHTASASAVYASRARRRLRARLASGWRAAPLPGGRRTLWIAAKGFRSHRHPPFQVLPCRNGRIWRKKRWIAG